MEDELLNNPPMTVSWTVAKQVLDNGTLVFQPFAAVQYRQDLHSTVYRCRAHNTHGAIVSRDMRTQAGQ
ncbi:down syndrome cell adhesion molecule [Danaus plexippus plexippus]|uniref:Down syndrome cell adhesion molecule n=1 Tax=Danaus plexippus plexippus TaxID=278856 RepID=A0A212F7V2_DANPL|nr:down syndrome cell adhesion molecule [Danaus plexippus plexippus]